MRRTVRGLGREASVLEVRILPAAIVDPNPSPGNGFGNSQVTLDNGNVVVTAPYDDAGGVDAGAVYLFNGSTGAVISTLRGSSANDRVGSGGIFVLNNPNGADNFLVRSSQWDNGTAVDAGALTWGSGVTGVSGSVGAGNSLVGSSSYDQVGSGNILQLYNGSGVYNYVVTSASWDNGAVTDAGAVTWGSGTTGIKGAISASNSLIGSTAGDQIGSYGVSGFRGNGVDNYLVKTPTWDHGGASNAGAVTWGSGTTGISGAVDATNSLVGTSANDQVGSGDIAYVWNNGSYNYVVVSSNWDNAGLTDAGAATFGSGLTGVSGAVSAVNSLVGSSAGDRIGSGGISTLYVSTGVYSYVVNSPNWDNGAVTDVGAVSWGGGAAGVKGAVTASNSLLGSSPNDRVGLGGVTVVRAADRDNYIVTSPNWDNGAATDAGAVTLGNGGTGVFGAVNSANSLVGTTAGNRVGSGGVTTLYVSTGAYNYVVNSPDWDNGALTDVGAVTWGTGTTGVSGAVTDANSLIGSSTNDRVGSGGITSVRVSNRDNYVVRSPGWDHAAIVDAGAVTWGSGASGITGAVTVANSLVGTSTDDRVGDNGIALVYANGAYNYLVQSVNWDNGAASNAGAVTWADGTTGLAGEVSAANSLVGTTSGDNVGSGGVTTLYQPNGIYSYIVNSPNWDNGGTSNAGAVSWASGATGVKGAVTAANSLVGTSANDRIGSGGITILYNNTGYNYVVNSPNWDDGAVANVGAVTWGSGATGIKGAVAVSNSLVGDSADDQIGSGSISYVYDGAGTYNYVVRSPNWDNGGVSNAGAFTWGSGLTGIKGTVGSVAGAKGRVASSGNSASVYQSGSSLIADFWTEGRIIIGSVATGFANDAPTNLALTNSSVAENAAIGTNVGTLSATDADPAQTFTFSLVAGYSDNNSFEIVGNTLRTKAVLDAETKRTYSIRVLVTDQGGSSLQKSFTVTVSDVDEHALSAITDQNGSVNRVAENAGLNTTVGVTARATDLDASSVITYSLSDDAGGRFKIHSTTGVVSTTGTLIDYEDATSYSINVVATNTADSGVTTTSQTFTITVTDVDEHDVSVPVDTDAAGSTVSEALAVGSAVGITAFAKDADGSNNTVTYILTDDANGLFDIDASTGVVTLKAPLDYETGTSHSITVRASSSDGSTASESFTITVTDEDEHDVTTPVDNDDAGSIVSEALTVGSTVGITAFATDDDGSDNTVTYTLTDDAGGLFDIDLNTGVVTLKAPLDYETATSHSITVRASSSDGSTASESFTITVTDEDEHDVTTPVDNDEAGSVVSEALTVGSTVGITAFAKDADGSNSTVTYSLTDDADGLFDIDVNTGVVTLKAPLDYETGTSHSITVRASSSDGSTASESFTITVTDEDEHDVTTPVDNDEAGSTVTEALAVGSTVGITAFATDDDGSDNTVTYSLTDDADGLFDIDANTGIVTLKAPLDFETSASHSITIQAASSDGSTASETFTITVTDVDEFDVGPVTDVNLADNIVSENATIGTLVGITASATDGDGTATVTYALTDNAGGRFEINATTGVVSVADGTLLDFETATSHQITVQAESNDGSKSLQTFTIVVANVLETPTLRLDDAVVAENQPTGTVVGSLFVTDAPAGAITYRLIGGTGGADNGRFRISGDKLVTRAAFDFEKKSSYSVRVQVRTASGFTETKVFTISVENVNEKPTALALSKNGFPENSPVGTAVGTFTGKDPDAGSTLTYALVPIAGQTDHLNFTIDNGVLKTAVVFDYETKSIYKLKVRVTDQGGESYEKTFTVYVRNVNEAPLWMTLSGTTVKENMRRGTLVGTLSSRDPDGSSPYKFSLVSGIGDSGNAKFRIVKNKLQTDAVLDFEEQSSYSIRVRVTDAGGASYEQVFVVNVGDVVGK